MKYKTKWVKRIVFVAFCFLICIVPLCPFLLSDSQHLVDLGDADTEKIFSIKDNIIEQPLLFEGTMKKMGIFFVTEINDVAENTNVTVTFSQGNVIEVCHLELNKIKSFQINYLTPDFKRFQDGLITVGFSMDSLSKNNIYIALCEDKQTALQGAVIQSVEQDAPVNVYYEYYKWTVPTKIGIALVFGIVVLIIAGAYLIESPCVKNYQLVLISIMIVVFVICIRQPTASYLGEPRSEAAYDFWQKAHNKAFFGSIMELECELYYLSFLQRIGAWIADTLSSTSKYVFVIMQMIQTFFIAITSCLILSKKVILKMNLYSRFLVAITLGTLLSPLYSYYFHFFGYWGIIFILIMAFFDMKKMNRFVYAGALGLTGIVCLSKMAYVVLVPFAIVLFLLFNKHLCKRYIIWLGDIIVSCLFQVLYTFTHTTVFSSPQGALGTIEIPNLARLVEGLFYYVVQGLNTFVFDSVHQNAFTSNVIILIFLLMFIIFSLHEAIRKNRMYMKMVICLGTMYFSVIGFCMLTSAGGFNMLSSIDWNSNVLLDHVHFFFLRFILLFIIFSIVEEYFENNKKNCFIVGTVVLIAIVSSKTNNVQEYVSTSRVASFPTEWKKVYTITHNESYYAPINVGYPYAGISLSQNSYGKIFGFDEQGNWQSLGQGVSTPCDSSRKYSSAIVMNNKQQGLISLNARKANAYLDSKYKVLLYNQAGELLAEKKQVSSSHREWIDFLFDKPVYGVYEVRFADEKTGETVYVCDELNLGISTFAKKISNQDSDLLRKMLSEPLKERKDMTLSCEYCNGQLILGDNKIYIDAQSNQMAFSGWAGDVQGEIPLQKLYIKFDNEIYEIPCDIERQDVSDMLQVQTIKKCGFEASLPVDVDAQSNQKTLQFILMNNEFNYQIIDYIVQIQQ